MLDKKLKKLKFGTVWWKKVVYVDSLVNIDLYLNTFFYLNAKVRLICQALLYRVSVVKT